jgi:hypothetical protein
LDVIVGISGGSRKNNVIIPPPKSIWLPLNASVLGTPLETKSPFPSPNVIVLSVIFT